MAKARSYQLTEGDKAIFAAARREKNPSRITNYYLRNEDSGTYWRPVTDSDIQVLEFEPNIVAARRWQTGYENLHAIWKHLRKPPFFGPSLTDPQDWQSYTEDQYFILAEALDRVYRVQFDIESTMPVFHHPHGLLLLPWHLDMARSKHPIQVVVGGFGSSKTYGKMLIMMEHAVTLPGYRGMAIAPTSDQANEVHRLALAAIEGTAFERFLVSAPTKPFPSLNFYNNYTGRTSIECRPGDDPGKFLTLTLDEAMIDQAEQMDGTKSTTIEEVIRGLGTRFRGTYRGRPRLGQMTFIANSGDNPQLWDLVDEADTDPDYVWSHAPATSDNIYLTIADLQRYEKQVGKDETSRRMYLLGERPIGNGEHFPQASLALCRKPEMDEEMTDAINNGKPGYVRMEAPRVACHRWEMPYVEGRRYIVAADPGWGTPPYRNAAAIGVWDITDFPRKPATMRAFCWVFGHDSPNPWIQQYTEYVMRYKAIGMNGYDGSGFQSGYEHMTEISELQPTPVILGNATKLTYLTLTKKNMADGLFAIPNITHLFSQCAKYVNPEPRTLRQDIVMMLFVTSALLETYRYIDYGPGDEYEFDPDDRYWRDSVERTFDVEIADDVFSRREDR